MCAGAHAAPAAGNPASEVSAVEDITARLRARFPDTAGARIARAWAGWWSVTKGQEVLFVDDGLTLIINGDVVRLADGRSITQELRAAAQPKVDVAALPVADAIRFGSAQRPGRRLIVISDPDCPYCRELERSLERLDGVEVLVFPMPIVELHPGAVDVSDAIWCAKDRAAAWRDYLLRGKQPPARAAGCLTPTERNVQLAESLGVQGTPALIFPDGTLVPGLIPLERIETMLRQGEHAQAGKGGSK